MNLKTMFNRKTGHNGSDSYLAVCWLSEAVRICLFFLKEFVSPLGLRFVSSSVLVDSCGPPARKQRRKK
jgi:hypothetical protein